MRKISYVNLGGTLFIPANHKNLLAVLKREKYPNLKSVLVDFEDGLNEQALDNALKAFEDLLKGYQVSDLYLFLRPKNEIVLRKLLEFDCIDKVDGFTLPKFSLLNAQEYLELLKDKDFYFMPSIESEELFEQKKLVALRELFLANKEKIILIRFGLEDMLRQLRMRRDCDNSIFDYSAPSVVLGTFIAIFKSVGFSISGGVYPCFKDKENFIKDVKRDIKEGLFSKTIIHPSQIELIDELYKVSQEELNEALKISKSENAVFAHQGKMAETKTMSPYAKEIVQRAEFYGVRTLL